MVTTRIAFRGQARAQSPQPLQIDGLVIGTSPGCSCFISFRGHACAATQIPSPHCSGWHLGKSTMAILPAIIFFLTLCFFQGFLQFFQTLPHGWFNRMGWPSGFEIGYLVLEFLNLFSAHSLSTPVDVRHSRQRPSR